VAADVYDEVLGALDAAASETGGGFAERLDAVLVGAADLNEADPTIAGFATALPADLRYSTELAPVRDQTARMRSFFLTLAEDCRIPPRRRDAVADACATLIAGLSRAAAGAQTPTEFRRTVESLRLLVKGDLFG